MASTQRRKNTYLSERLFAEPTRYQFFQAVRLLEAINHDTRKGNATWHQYPVGYDYAQQKELVRFKVEPTLKFPDGEISQLTAPHFNPEKGILNPAQMHVTFMGLTGPSGALPMHYSETILEQNRARNYALADFFDLFNHRAISLYYRGWEKYRVEFSFERHRRANKQNDPLSQMTMSILGDHRLSKNIIKKDSLRFYAGLLGNHHRSANQIEQILSDYFAIPVKIQSFIGSWNRLERSERTRMPSHDHPEGQYNLLGKNAVLGKQVWYSQGKFRIILGPLSPKDFKKFLPGAPGLIALKELTRYCVSDEFNFDIQLISTPHDLPSCQLAKDHLPQLGYFTWLKGTRSHLIENDKLVLL